MTKASPASSVETTDSLAVEEPLEIRVGYHDRDIFRHRAVSITMRTPGDDPELAAGFLFTEGIINSPENIEERKHWGPEDTEGVTNTIRGDLAKDVDRVFA